jgi:hypothetical protein
LSPRLLLSPCRRGARRCRCPARRKLNILEVPSGWKPKGDTDDESVEASSPDDHAYLMAWMVKGEDLKALVKDLATRLDDSMKSVDPGYQEKKIEQHGTKFAVVSGSGVDKREGSKVKFLVGIFPVGDGQAGNRLCRLRCRCSGDHHGGARRHPEVDSRSRNSRLRQGYGVPGPPGNTLSRVAVRLHPALLISGSGSFHSRGWFTGA